MPPRKPNKRSNAEPSQSIAKQPKRADNAEADNAKAEESTEHHVAQESHTPSTLETLPRELAFALFDYVPECLFELRQASSALYARIGEYAHERSTIRLVEEIRLDTKNSDQIHVIVSLPKSKSYLFEQRFKLRRASVDSKTRIIRTGHTVANKPNLYKFEWSEEDADLWDCIVASTGKLIGRVSLFNCFVVNLFNEISKILSVFQFKILEIEVEKLWDSSAEFLLNTISSHAINHLSLCVEYSRVKDRIGLLYKLSSLVQSMYIKKYATEYGYRNLDWAEILLKMFSNKMDKLLFNDFRSELLNKQRAEALMERLPFVGKKVWFTANCSEYFVKPSVFKSVITCPDSPVNDHEIKVHQLPLVEERYYSYTPTLLAIKHLSRIHEDRVEKSKVVELRPNRPI